MEFLKFARVQWDRTIAVAAAVLGAIFLLGGFIGVSNTPFVGAQLPYFISGGMTGIFLLGIAATAWLSADLRDEWRELRAIRGLLDEDLRHRRDDLLEDDVHYRPTPRSATTTGASAGKSSSRASAAVRRRADAEPTTST